MNSFTQFELLASLKASLKENKFFTPTEIQSRAIPLLLNGSSVVGVSQTGSGKTLAFALPLLHLVKTIENNGTKVTDAGRPLAAIIVPTRDLGEQVSRVLKPFTHTTRVRVRTVLGGTTTEQSTRNVSDPFEILVATPGRLVQLMDRNRINLDLVQFLIFDEADQMLDQGFLTDAKKIIGACLPEKQLGLFSATISPVVQELMKELFANAEVVRIDKDHKIVPTLTTVNKTLVDGIRFPELKKILSQPSKGGTLIFTNTRDQCDKLESLLKEAQIPCLIYRGEMDKVQRRANLKAFREGKIRVLVSTDLASRGLDVEHVERVVNYHLPKEMINYVHRVGRTARAGRKGTVYNLVTERDWFLMKNLGASESVPTKQHRQKSKIAVDGAFGNLVGLEPVKNNPAKNKVELKKEIKAAVKKTAAPIKKSQFKTVSNLPKLKEKSVKAFSKKKKFEKEFSDKPALTRDQSIFAARRKHKSF